MNGKGISLGVYTLVIAALWPLDGRAFDPFSVNDYARDKNIENCVFEKLGSPLTIGEAVVRAICNSTKSRNGREDVIGAAAALGVSESAWLPVVTVSVDGSQGRTHEQPQNDPANNFDVPTLDRSLVGDINWVLYDFGVRSEDDEAAKQKLFSSLAGNDAARQSSIADVALAFFNAAALQAMLESKMQQEKDALEVAEVAEQRHRAGAASLADVLQARTSYSQSSSERIQAEKAARSADGTLAVAMGIDANSGMILSPLPVPPRNESYLVALDTLMDEAKRGNPNIVAAQAALASAQANRRSVEDSGLPTLSLVGEIERANTMGQITIRSSAYSTDKTIGLKLSVPLSNWVVRSYQIDSAVSDEEKKKISFDDAVKQTSLYLWNSYNDLNLSIENLGKTDEFLSDATRSFDVARSRYRSGAVTVLDLLSAQTALGNARQQRIQAVSDWLSSRIKLLESLGQLDSASVH